MSGISTTTRIFRRSFHNHLLKKLKNLLHGLLPSASVFYHIMPRTTTTDKSPSIVQVLERAKYLLFQKIILFSTRAFFTESAHSSGRKKMEAALQGGMSTLDFGQSSCPSIYRIFRRPQYQIFSKIIENLLVPIPIHKIIVLGQCHHDEAV